ncbi:hypothetical protein CVT26_008376 [Gymnopilus dilepis]|uniref:Uncharacterized protein n=1 Tax=Gymnopilus dilepis TaxID=231916 RepID=A0A409X6U8_9AGAR|nr:hypothetical protein CVT26_008376 [Gymnopilus dilepis]
MAFFWEGWKSQLVGASAEQLRALAWRDAYAAGAGAGVGGHGSLEDCVRRLDTYETAHLGRFYFVVPQKSEILQKLPKSTPSYRPTDRLRSKSLTRVLR